jgi:hypothetical protein
VAKVAQKTTFIEFSCHFPPLLAKTVLVMRCIALVKNPRKTRVPAPMNKSILARWVWTELGTSRSCTHRASFCPSFPVVPFSCVSCVSWFIPCSFSTLCGGGTDGGRSMLSLLTRNYPYLCFPVKGARRFFPQRAAIRASAIAATSVPQSVSGAGEKANIRGNSRQESQPMKTAGRNSKRTVVTTSWPASD